MSSKAKALAIIFGFLVIISLIVLSAFIWYQTNTPKFVFQRCIDSVVEVKATTDDVGESFGTAVLLTEDGRFITNAHVISYEEYGDHIPNEAFVQNGVKFDGVLDGKLVDTKNHYSQFVDKSTGKFAKWFTGKDELINEAARQIGASNGATIQWYFSEETSLNAVKALFEGTEAEVIELILKVMG